MDKVKILWADDEIDLLKPHVLFLKTKGYDVITVSNGHDAVEELEKSVGGIDVVFLDESMPGLTGLETLMRMKTINPMLPVVMITKNEAENVMEEAIGSQITDYLIKPVNPNQILLTLKKIIDNKRLVSAKTASDYQQDFRQIFMQINSGLDFEEWADTYRKIVQWELKLDQSRTTDMGEILAMQKAQANTEFSKFVEKNYLRWLNGKAGDNAPVMSPNLLREMVFKHINENTQTVLLLLDNLRYDQWKVIEPIINEYYKVEEENFFYSILPTSTQYSRNAIFAGMTPLDIQKRFPQWWLDDTDKGGKNMYEQELLTEQVKRVFRRPIKLDYHKITNGTQAKELQDGIHNALNYDLSVVVYNFIDMLSHARTEMEVLKELASDEAAYRSLTRSWFLHSPLWAALQLLAKNKRKVQLFITTDHGTIRVNQPSKVVGDRETTTNLRYKVGRNLQYEAKDVLAIRTPEEAMLPRPNVSSTYIFAKNDTFFLYPNNYNHFNSYYKNTFQHGGISLEEIICPIIRLTAK